MSHNQNKVFFKRFSENKVIIKLHYMPSEYVYDYLCLLMKKKWSGPELSYHEGPANQIISYLLLHC